MITNDIPLEGVLKYIKAERDKYKDKVKVLTDYAHSLEKKVNNLMTLNEMLNDTNASLLKKCADLSVQREEIQMAKRLVGENNMLKSQNASFLKELKAMREDFRESDWYKQIHADNARLRVRHKELMIAYNKLLVQRNENN